MTEQITLKNPNPSIERMSIGDMKTMKVKYPKHYWVSTESNWGIREKGADIEQYYVYHEAIKKKLHEAIKKKLKDYLSKGTKTIKQKYLSNSRNRFLVDQVLLHIGSEEGKLSKLFEEVDESKNILKQTAGWDGGHAVPIERETYEKTISFLYSYTLHLVTHHELIIDSPEINACRDGSIDLSWEVNGNRLLINIKNKPEGFRASYYGQIPDKFQKGSFPAEEIDEPLVQWMKHYKI